MKNIKFCDYGCGREAKYKMTSGKWCCEEFYQKCPKLREKNIIGATGKKRTDVFKRKISSVHKGKIVKESQKLKQKRKMINLRKDPGSKYNTKEYIERNKVCNIGRKWSEQQTKKFSKTMTGRKRPKLFYWNSGFWSSGYFASTVGNVSQDKILDYIRKQEDKIK